MDKNQFERDPRAFAMELVENGLVSAESLLSCALKYMSCDDVRDMLDCNELSPRFDEDEDEDEESQPDMDSPTLKAIQEAIDRVNAPDWKWKNPEANQD